LQRSWSCYSVEKVGSKTISRQSQFHRIRDIEQLKSTDSVQLRPFVLVIMQGTMNMVSMPLAKVLVVLNPSKRLDQKLFLVTRSSIEFETSSNSSLRLPVNNKLQESVRLGFVSVSYKGLGVLNPAKRSGQKLFLASCTCNEFETSSDRSLPLFVNNECRVSVHLGYSARDDCNGDSVAH
jgi:hypothetical protein